VTGQDDVSVLIVAATFAVVLRQGRRRHRHRKSFRQTRRVSKKTYRLGHSLLRSLFVPASPAVKRERYMHSRRWQTKRNRALRRGHYRCAACGYHNRHGHGLDVHHTCVEAYGRLGHERRSDLMPLCHRCHATVTGLHRTGGLTIAEATRRVVGYR
jgi:hypothetical protein